jgi:alpha-beta hydrolase superfamily lysophospholipase
MLSRSPTVQAFETKLLFVHGAWHGAWCWKNFMDYFSERGFACWAPDLPGHGQRSGDTGLRKQSMMDYVDEVDRAAREIGNPVVIAHSFGGYVAMKYLERAQPPAAVLMTPMPFRNLPRLTLLKMSAQYPRMLPRFLTLRLVPIDSEKMYRRFFHFNAPTSVCEEGCKKACAESSLALMGGAVPTVRLRPELVESPTLLLAAGHDYFFPEKAERRTAQAYRSDFKLYPDMGHNLMVEQGWETVAGDIFDWLQTRVT